MPPTLPAGETGTTRRVKRSATISLVLIAGAGAAAFLLARRDPSQREEDALVYDNDGACIAAGVRPADACIAAYRAALDSDAAGAPRYPTLAACERHHGPGGCTARTGDKTGDGTGNPAVFVPLMAGYMIGRTEAQGLPAQPLYRHAPEEEREAAGGSGGFASGYCTGAGGRVFTTGGGSVARVSSAVARTTTSAPRTLARGGFGATGRAVSAFSSHAGGSGGG
ncbi:DUF1190 domain-containing protein [Methylobacterium mesophilicum SR1.6/6]|uniref:DUF1190 domain-containing protein n=1 Tax=Methylobacterium mesophilicum SR1.6/6 TaxID=908290 RepID=A0A6B9FAJ8_9HYPH|nr:DUF1190 domain-containing protein [Methylobacterium mesophilicum]QGY00820.1 DUF1190 domain-containing protein [Methylobacterium mesophilicum SR1.6/6]